MAAFYGAASYHGHVDVGLAVVGIEGGVSGSRRALDFYGQDYGAPTYTRTERLSAAELGDPERIAGEILRPLMTATAGDAFDPFA